MRRHNFIFLHYCILLVIVFFVSETQLTSNASGEKKAPAEFLFERLFKQRRVEQVEAVKGLMTLDGYEKQYKMIQLVAEKVFNVVQASRAIVEASGFIPGTSKFPEDKPILDALVNILENTALFSDIILHLPDVTHRVLDTNTSWTSQLHWSVAFCKDTRLLDSSTEKLLDLVDQEMNVELRHADYVNPYAHKEVKKVMEVKKRKRKEMKKGPRLSASKHEL